MSKGTKHTVALICFPNGQVLPNWPGERRVMPNHLFHAAETVKAWAAQTTADYVLFWDTALGLPNIDTCYALLEKPGEVWHSGLQLGLCGQPEVMNYLRPSWLLHLDAAPEIGSDSWKLSLRACLIKTEIIRQVGVFRSDFSNFEAAGLEWGFRMQRSGALLRHEPFVLNPPPISLNQGMDIHNSLLFTALHFPRYWFWWVVFRLFFTGAGWGGLIRGIWQKKPNKPLKINSLPRPLDPEKNHFKLQDWHAKVSVLMPTLNRYPYVINSIEQLMRQTVGPKEILATDQTDSESRWEGFAREYPLVKVFHQTEKGQCIAWNKLLEASTAPYVLFLGDDADGIQPDFLEKMCRTMAYYQADMVASHVIEIGGAADPYQNRVLTLAEGFPITLIKKDLVLRAGGMDMAFNKGIRADQDLAIRCRMLGAHMIFDSEIRILHHRAPVGGLRWHQQRVLTRHISKNNPFKIQYPAESEYYLFRKHFTQKQRREHAYILMLSQFFVHGSAFKKAIRVGIYLLSLPKILIRYSRFWR